MGLIAKDIPTLVQMLLPGFIAAGIFYTLTAHPRLSEFERLIQALIFTSILRAATIVVRGALLTLGRSLSIGAWTDDVELVWSVFLAIPVGLIFAYMANFDIIHEQLRRLNLTQRTSFPSEWYNAFSRERRWINSAPDRWSSALRLAGRVAGSVGQGAFPLGSTRVAPGGWLPSPIGSRRRLPNSRWRRQDGRVLEREYRSTRKRFAGSGRRSSTPRCRTGGRQWERRHRNPHRIVLRRTNREVNGISLIPGRAIKDQPRVP